MGKTYDAIPPHIMDWIPKQHLFFVSSAPLQADGHVNVSPKGYEDTFHIVNDKQVWYEDLSGSGIETISHMKQNGRITIMFMALTGAPNVIRLFGTGCVHEFGSAEYETLISPTTRKPGSRAAIVIDIHKVTTACGYGVPIFKFERDRKTAVEFCNKAETWDRTGEKEGLKHLWKLMNTSSMDGLLGLEVALQTEKAFDEHHELNMSSDVKPSGETQGGSNGLGNGLSGGLLGFAIGAVVATACCKVMALE